MAEEQPYGYSMPAANVTLNINLTELPQCPECEKGVLLPLPDETKMGNVLLKGWCCSHCYHNVMLKAGELVSQPKPSEL